MSIGVICIFDPVIFDPAIFTCCGAMPGGAADKRRETREERLERENIERKRNYDNWRIKKKEAEKLKPKLVHKTIEKPKQKLSIDPKLAENVAKELAKSTIYKIYQESERQRLINEANAKQQQYLELIRKDEEDALFMLLVD